MDGREREKNEGREINVLIRPLIVLDKGLTLMTTFNLNYLLKALSPNSHIWS